MSPVPSSGPVLLCSKQLARVVFSLLVKSKSGSVRGVWRCGAVKHFPILNSWSCYIGGIDHYNQYRPV